MENIEKIKPSGIFTNYIYKAIPLAFDESMSYYETLCGVLNLLKDQEIIVNNNADALKELQDYVTHYFDNLDVQEEINNKLDKMVESGTLQEIMEQYLHAMRSYDNIYQMIEDTTLQPNQKVYCNGYSINGDKGNGYYIISNENLTENKLTIIKLNNNLYAKLLYKDNIYVVDQSILTKNLIESLLNNNVMLYTDEPIFLTSSIEIVNDNVKIKNMKFTSNVKETQNTIFQLYVKSNNVEINNCYFTGNCTNFLRFENSSNSKVINNTFDGKNLGQTSGLVISHSNTIIVSNNKFIDCSGFNLQTLISKNLTINSNTFKNSFYEYYYVADGGETTLNFDMNIVLNRYNTRINNIFTQCNISVDDETHKHVTLITPNPLSEGDILIFRNYQTLEPMNINANTYDTTISNNVIDGSGDSGIVLGSDYHNGILDPSNVTSYDLPRRISVTNNAITNCGFAGIFSTIKDITISNNTISNCGWITSGLYSAGIFLSYNTPSVITNNTISNIITNDGYQESETGIMRYGISITPIIYTSANSPKYQIRSGQIYIRNNIFDKLERQISTQDDQALQTGLNFDSDSEYISDELNGITETNGIFNVYGTATASLDTVEKIDRVNSIKVNATASGQYTIFNNSIISNITNHNVEIEFFAKASEENAFNAIILYNTSYVSRKNYIVQPINTEWKRYCLNFQVYGKPTLFEFRLQSTKNASCNICHIRYKLKPLNVGTNI